MERKIKITQTKKEAFKDKIFSLDQIDGVIISSGSYNSEIFYFENNYEEQCQLVGEEIKMNLLDTVSHLKTLIG